jgi:hypothetical protein
VVTVVEVEGGLFCAAVDLVVDGELNETKYLIPVLLVVVDKSSQCILKHAV